MIFLTVIEGTVGILVTVATIAGVPIPTKAKANENALAEKLCKWSERSRVGLKSNRETNKQEAYI